MVWIGKKAKKNGIDVKSTNVVEFESLKQDCYCDDFSKSANHEKTIVTKIKINIH